MNRTNKRNRLGFSLIEVTMAVGVLAVGALALIGLFPMGLNESVVAQSDMRQAMFNDLVLSCATAVAADPEVRTESQFKAKFNSAVNTLGLTEGLSSSDGSLSEFNPSGNVRERMYYRVWLRSPAVDKSKTTADVHVSHQVCVQSTDRAKAGTARDTLLMSPVYIAGIYLPGDNTGQWVMRTKRKTN